MACVENADGYQRMMCPAEASKAQCPIKPYTMGRGIHLPLIDPEPSPTGPLKICRQRTITVSPDAGAKQWQALDYGSPEWQKVYFRLRNSVEGYNGYAKNPLAEGIESAGSRRIRGIAASRHKRSCSPSSWPTRTAARSRSGWTRSRSAASVPADAPTTAAPRKSRGAGPRPATWHQRHRSTRPRRDSPTKTGLTREIAHASGPVV